MEEYLAILKKYWGYDAFRPLQPEIIMSIGSGRDTLGLMPTGGGKSLTFQVPALAKEGVCIVVTPLISLMKDQVANLRRRGVMAAAIHSGLSYDEMIVAFDNCIYGGCKFLYLSPERLSTELFQIKLVNMKVCMLVVDEAHCISQWGYDFRPSYLNISEVRNLIPDVPVLALTATATPAVVDDIMAKLGFKQPNVFRKSFARPNIAYIVRECENKEQQMLQILERVPGSSVVYVRNRRRTREYAELLAGNGVSAAYFHAGLTVKEKDRIQEAWTKNTIRVIVCTNAFGMGIDKPDVRTVIHMDAPDSLEAYFQEAGRAGRDGNKSFAVFLWSKADARKLRKCVTDSFPSKEEILDVYNKVADSMVVGVEMGEGAVFDFDIGKFCANFKKSLLAVHYSLKLLTGAGYVNYQEDVEMSSRVMFTVQRHDLYNVQVKHPKLDVVIKVLLRSYTGLFTEYSVIDEERVAKLCEITRQELYERLLMLARMHVLNYNPQKKSTLVSWTRDRVHDRFLLLPREVYDDRLADMRQRTESVISYCQTASKCRSVQLLSYFGEKRSAPCGHCDVCIEKRKRGGVDVAEFESVEDGVVRALACGAQSFEAISAECGASSQLVEAVLHWMSDFGEVVYDASGHYRLVEKDA